MDFKGYVSVHVTDIRGHDDINIHQFVEKIFTQDECAQLIEFYNASGAGYISLGLLPFVNHAAMVRVLKNYQDRTWLSHAPPSLHPDHAQKLITKLDLDQYWMDITTIDDHGHVEYNTVTEEYRYTSYEEYNLCNYVRPTLR